MFLVALSNLIIFVFFIIMLSLISSFLYTRYLLVLYAYVSIELIECILLSSFQLKTNLIDFFSKRIMLFTYKSSLYFWYYFIVIYVLFMIFSKIIQIKIIFFKCLIFFKLSRVLIFFEFNIFLYDTIWYAFFFFFFFIVVVY